MRTDFNPFPSAKFLAMQALYGCAGIAFNLVSIAAAKGPGPLTPTDPLAGILAMLVYLAFLWAGLRGRVRVYTWLMFTAIIVLGYGGVVTHAWNLLALPSEPAGYLGFWSLAAALGINLFGLVLNVLGILRGRRAI